MNFNEIDHKLTYKFGSFIRYVWLFVAIVLVSGYVLVMAPVGIVRFVFEKEGK